MKHRHSCLKPLWPLAALLLAASLPSASGVEALLTDDSYIYSGSATTLGAGNTMVVNSTTTKSAIMRFEIASMLPANVSAENVATATLRVFNSTAPTGTGSIGIYKILSSKSWDETTASGVWVAGTDYDATAVLSGVSVSNFAVESYTALDVTSAVKAWITTPSSNNGLIIRPSGTIGLTLVAKEYIYYGHNAVIDIVLKGDLGEVAGLYNTTYGVGALLSNTDGSQNLAIGYQALFGQTTGDFNIAIGYQALYSNAANTDGNLAIGPLALYSNTTGGSNLAIGYRALVANTTGYALTALGASSLYSNTTGNYNSTINGLVSNTTGSQNTAYGYNTLYFNTTADNNTAIGFNALENSTGANNVAVGSLAGLYLTTGSNNIDIGHGGIAGEGNTIRIGTQGTQTATYIAGISGATAASGVAVYIDSNGHLGTLTSSSKFKREIRDMKSASEVILSLRPVNFRYNKEIDARSIPQYGLIAEDVAEIAPDLVAYDANGDIYTVRYEAVNAMLLNEFQKEHQRVAAQEQMIARQQEQIAKLSEYVSKLTTRFEAEQKNTR